MFSKLKLLLTNNFEKNLLDEALNNLHTNSKIRFSNFAFVIRELIDVLLANKASNDDVKRCHWYIKPESINRDVARNQRIKYIIQGGLPYVFLKYLFHVDVEGEIQKINKYFRDELSSHVHINEESLSYSKSQIDEKVNKFENIVDAFWSNINGLRDKIINLLSNEIHEIATDEFLSDTIGDLDILSTHTQVDYLSDLEIEIKEITSKELIGKISGVVHILLQYGSDRDRSRGDGAEIEDSYPFTIPFTIVYPSVEDVFDDENPEDLAEATLNECGKIFQKLLLDNLILGEITVDTTSFYE